HIGLCVYNVAVVCIIGVPLGFIISDENFEGRYVIKSLFVILCTTVILCIVFLPKIYSVYRDPSGDVEIRFQTAATRGPSLHASKITPLQQMTENITIQRRLENLLKEKDQRIKELEGAVAGGETEKSTVYPSSSAV
ncbi:gamma-aminobutyric acid type b receptor subunit 2, partial [Plakobranchus ocellatus]